MTTPLQLHQYDNLTVCFAEITVALNSIQRIVKQNFPQHYDDVEECVANSKECHLTLCNALLKIGDRLETETLEN